MAFLWLLLLSERLRQTFGVSVITGVKRETVCLLRQQDLIETRSTLSVWE